MEFHVGDSVMHWAFGLGRIASLEEKMIEGTNQVLCYAVEIGNMTIWVPVNSEAESKLRAPTSESGLKKLKALLLGKPDPLPADRNQRRLMLTQMLKGGSAEANCKVLCSLLAFKKKGGTMSDNDQALIRQTKKSLVEEWSASLSISTLDAEIELQKLLNGE